MAGFSPKVRYREGRRELAWFGGPAAHWAGPQHCTGSDSKESRKHGAETKGVLLVRTKARWPSDQTEVPNLQL